MLQFGKELVSIVKCKNKEGCENLKALHFKINDILFALNGKLLFKPTASKAYNALVELGKTVKELEVPDKAQPKKEEILSQLRNRCQKLRSYIFNYKEEDSDIPVMQRAINFWVHLYLDAKEKNELTSGRIVELLEESRALWDNTKAWRDNLKMSTLVNGNKELLKMLYGRYEARDNMLDDYLD